MEPIERALVNAIKSILEIEHCLHNWSVYAEKHLDRELEECVVEVISHYNWRPELRVERTE